ncbi:hypothetical protein [Gordonia iterans]
MRDVEADYKAAYEAEHAALKAAGLDKAAARIAEILGRTEESGKKPSRRVTRGKEAASPAPETADEK